MMKYPDANFSKDILLRQKDDNQGIEIYGWNMEDPMPTEKDLDLWAIELDLPYRQKIAVQQRVYPPVAEQLDMMYHDNLNKTSVWMDTITAIKAAHPKPME